MGEGWGERDHEGAWARQWQGVLPAPVEVIVCAQRKTFLHIAQHFSGHACKGGHLVAWRGSEKKEKKKKKQRGQPGHSRRAGRPRQPLVLPLSSSTSTFSTAQSSTSVSSLTLD